MPQELRGGSSHRLRGDGEGFREGATWERSSQGCSGARKDIRGSGDRAPLLGFLL